MAGEAIHATVAPRAAFQHRDFRRYVASWSLANLGEQMLGVAVGWQVYAITHRAIDLGYVGLVQFVPAFGLSLLAGSVADRVDRRRLVAVCNLALAACALALAAIAAYRLETVAPIYAVLFLAGVARAFDAPAGQALVPEIVAPQHFPNAVSWTSTAWQASTIVGPVAGGLLYGVAGDATWVYAACAALHTSASLLALSLRPRPSAADKKAMTWSEVLAGLHFVRAHPLILESVSLDLFAVLLGGATALLPIFASDVLHVGPRGLGALRSAPAVGAAAMAVALAYRPLTRRAGPILLACVATFGLATIVFGLSRNFGLSLASLVVLGASDMVSVVLRATVVQLRTPHEMRGRVSAVSMMFITASSDLGGLESGVTAAWWGAVPAVVVGGFGTLVVVAMYTFWFRTLRGMDRLDEAGLDFARGATP
jgi:MFS family permease